jgi:hypothetical protein
MKKLLTIIMVLSCLVVTALPPAIIPVGPGRQTQQGFSWDASNPKFRARPGTVFQLDPGTYAMNIKFVGLKGTADSPIIIRNTPGQITKVTSPVNYCLYFVDCQYIKIQGDNINNFIISNPFNPGLIVNGFLSHVEISKVQVCNTGGPGIMVKCDPTCTSSADNWTIHEVSVHDCYVHNTGCEGLYIGSTFYHGKQMVCDNQTVTIMPPAIIDCKIYNNTVVYTGWTGIEISNCKKTLCSNNIVLYDSRALNPVHMAGFMINGGSAGTWTNNLVQFGFGTPIQCFGTDTVHITKNQLSHTDSVSHCPSIYINDKEANQNTLYIVDSNTGQTNQLPVIRAFCTPKVSSFINNQNKIIFVK